MTKLEELTPGTLVRGLASEGVVRVLHVEWHGADTVTLTFWDEGSGRAESRPIFRWILDDIQFAEGSGAWSSESLRTLKFEFAELEE